ncbi:MAG: twin-arginine translocase TatA/TatE family subunit [Planctomycetota bacterium]
MVLMDAVSTSLGIFGLPGGGEWIIILVIGLLLFGRRLPEIGRSAGKSIVEFKKGLKDVKDEIDEVSNESRALPNDPARRGDVPSARVGGETENPYTPSTTESGSSA